MLIKRLKVKPVVTKISRGKIHGQGDSKRYVFILLETDIGNSFSEVYCGSYDYHSVSVIVNGLNDRLAGKVVDLQQVHANFLHQPFISGAGLNQTIISSVYNCILLLDLSWKLGRRAGSAPAQTYISGGTVKSTLNEMEAEIAFAESLGVTDYKIRLDYRDLGRCLDRLGFLNRQSVNYALDLIVNTNHATRGQLMLEPILERLDPSKLLWLEEPIFPTAPEEWEPILDLCHEKGITVALGESLTSRLEMDYVLNHMLIGMVQIDATHCADLVTLQNFKQRVVNREKILGFHNWGSHLTLILNGLLGETSEQCFFEIPYYQTEFDTKLLQTLGRSVEELINPSICFNDFDSTREIIYQMICEHPESEYKDFRWS